jgi:RNA-directed DNA polymerase
MQRLFRRLFGRRTPVSSLVAEAPVAPPPIPSAPSTLSEVVSSSSPVETPSESTFNVAFPLPLPEEGLPTTPRGTVSSITSGVSLSQDTAPAAPAKSLTSEEKLMQAIFGDKTPETTKLSKGTPHISPDPQVLEQRLAEDRDWFGQDLWGTSAGQLSATIDVDKLQRFNLPILYTEHDIADWLNIPLNRLRWYTFDKPADTTWHYTRRVIPKRNGGERVILAPKKELKALQRRVLDELVSRMPVATSVHGFVPERSITTNAQQHVGKAVVMKLDLKDFFPSVTFPRVRGLFIAMGYSYAVASTIALLCTEYDREAFVKDDKTYYISIGPRHLVQGAPTSPSLANLVAWKLDKRLKGLANKYSYTYTRYADDLTFSGEDESSVHKIRHITQHIVADEHFAVNPPKTRISRQCTRQIVTGLVVNEQVAVPRNTRRQLRAIIHNVKRDGLEAQNRANHPHFASYISGMIAFVNAANSEQAAKLSAQFRETQ